MQDNKDQYIKIQNAKKVINRYNVTETKCIASLPDFFQEFLLVSVPHRYPFIPENNPVSLYGINTVEVNNKGFMDADELLPGQHFRHVFHRLQRHHRFSTHKMDTHII